MRRVLRYTDGLLHITVERMINDQRGRRQSNVLQKIVSDAKLTSYIGLKRLESAIEKSRGFIGKFETNFGVEHRKREKISHFNSSKGI